MDKQIPLVSVVTATYKRFNRLYDTIQSVLSQNYNNIEYIITDDGSDDFPRDEILNFLESNCPNNIKYKVIHHKNNIGTVRNMNNAYKLANGQFLINLSCGDVFFTRNVVSQITNRFLKLKCDVLTTSRMVYSGDYNPLYLLPHYKERDIIKQYDSGLKQYKAFVSSGFYDMASGSAMSFSKSIIEKMGYFDEKYFLWEDGPFIAKYLQIGKLEFAYDIISIWYENNGISSGSVANVNPKLKKDIDEFSYHEKIAHLDKLSIIEKRRMKYRNKKNLGKGKLYNIWLDFFYLPEVLFFVRYTVARKRYKYADKAYINSIMKEKDKKVYTI